MKSTFTSLVCRFMIVALMMLPFQSGQAAMIGTDQVNASAATQLDRSVVLNFLTRAQTSEQLQTLGIDSATANARVAAMSDSEVGMLAGKINALPVGADGGLALLVLVIFFIWYFAFRK
jgi:hypothetical protein